MNLKDKLVKSMADNKVIDQDEIDVYSFGVQLLSETVISFAIFLIIAALFGSVAETIVFTAAFALLRQYGGGFHASKFIYCLLISCGIVGGFCFLIRFADLNLKYAVVLSCISLPIIFMLAPVDSKYKPIQKTDETAYKRKLIILLVIEMIVAIITAFFSLHYVMCIVLSWCTLAMLMLAGHIQNKHDSSYNEKKYID